MGKQQYSSQTKKTEIQFSRKNRNTFLKQETKIQCSDKKVERQFSNREQKYSSQTRKQKYSILRRKQKYSS